MGEVKSSDITFYEANARLDEYNRRLKNNFVGIGYTLKRVREDKLFLEAGYKNFDEFMNAKYGKDKSWASKCINIAVQFGQGEDTPVIQDKYADYEFNKLVELIYLPEDKRQEVTSKTSVREIRELKPKKEKKVSTVKTPEPPKWNTNPTPCIHREEYSCTVPDDKKSIPGDGSNCGQSCCWECTKRGDCKWECNSSQSRPEEPDPPKQISELEFSSRTENTLKRAGIDTVDKLASMSEEGIATVRGMSARTLEEIRTKLEDKPEPETVVDAEYEEVQPDHSDRIYTMAEVAQEIYRLEAAYMGAPEEVRQSNHYRKNMMRLDAMRLLYESMQGN